LSISASRGNGSNVGFKKDLSLVTCDVQKANYCAEAGIDKENTQPACVSAISMHTDVSGMQDQVIAELQETANEDVIGVLSRVAESEVKCLGPTSKFPTPTFQNFRFPTPTFPKFLTLTP